MSAKASSNWLALQKSLKGVPRHENERPKKRRKLDKLSEGTPEASAIVTEPESDANSSRPHDVSTNRDSVTALRGMVLGQTSYPAAHLLPGKFLAIDCEMVGIAGDSSKKSLSQDQDESSLARVSVVNYYGAVQLDVFVKQRERVTDWRTAVSGVRESDMVNAKSFSHVQKAVADLLKGNILVGHAVQNDLKALLLSHPHNMTRDTQILAGRHGTLSTLTPPVEASAGTASVKPKRNRKPALRKIVSQELGLEIQGGEHSSVIDARATMAIYRLHRKIWDQGFARVPYTSDRKTSQSKPHAAAHDPDQEGPALTRSSKSRKRDHDDMSSDSEEDEETGRHSRQGNAASPSVQRKGISSGLSVVIKKRKAGAEVKQVITGTRGAGKNPGEKTKWWGSLGKS